jgi:hypothetical protein
MPIKSLSSVTRAARSCLSHNLTNLKKAHALIESRRARGKLVLAVECISAGDGDLHGRKT